MDDLVIAWIAAIVIGGAAGWVAEEFMKSDMGVLMNIVLGAVGGVLARVIFSFLGVNPGGWLGFIVAAFVGACLLIWIVREVRGPT